MATVKFGVFSKRRNSTKQPTTELSDSRTVVLKEDCSQDRPIFKVTGNNFNYNYCEWDSKYYFIEDIVSLRNNEIEVYCILDPLATYKTEILASTQFVSYSSSKTSIWLPDTRIPVQKNAIVHSSSAAIGILDKDGFYVLTVIGKESAAAYKCSLINIKDMLGAISTWENTGIQTAQAIIQSYTPASADEIGLGQAINDTLKTIGEAMVRTGFVGNAYADAPSCIRSCIWVPFGYALYEGNSHIWLGNFDTGVDCRRISTKPTEGDTTVSIPWNFSDWRRALCEEVYLYLPLVGMVSIPSDEIINETSISIHWSATASDGCISYELKAGNQIIGTYGGNASANYPIGISQQASAGEVFQSILAGADKMMTTALSASSSLNPAAWGMAAPALGMEAFNAAYDYANIKNTRHNSCIGGIGGGSGVGLGLDVVCFTVAHPTVIAPDDMQATMGLPTMIPKLLSTLSGFCQCANAHVEAPATAGELDAIDAMLNAGFYIE